MPYRILSLDGGGTWAMIQARVLKDLYQTKGAIRGHEVLKQFDLVVANSGGSLVLAALCHNLEMDAIIHIFEDEAKRRQVFHAIGLFQQPVSDQLRPAVHRTLVWTDSVASTAAFRRPLTSLQGLLCYL